MNQSNGQTRENMRVAVASYEGILVNQHLGMAASLIIFEVNREGFRQVERRTTPKPGNPERWQTLAALLADCQALLVSNLGKTPQDILSGCGLKVYQVDGMIEDALRDLYDGLELRMPAHAPSCRCAGSGSPGTGCG
jgi:nitrogen fixation protein NifB